MESLDTGLRSVAEIESITELPSLAVVPRMRRPSRTRWARSRRHNAISMCSLSRSRSSLKPFDHCEPHCCCRRRGHPPKFILFTSATPSEGKTTTASNLACTLAQRDTKVLLIDADLRRPNMHHRFGLNGKVGLTTVLSGTTTLEETVQQIPEVPNLDVLPSGPYHPFRRRC